ncbi:MAG: sialate O-acetylesterase [Coraliomargarita sp.]
MKTIRNIQHPYSVAPLIHASHVAHTHARGSRGGPCLRLPACLALSILAVCTLFSSTTPLSADTDDSLALYNLPEGVDDLATVLDSGDNWTLPLAALPPLMFLADTVNQGNNSRLYWEDAPWGLSYYFPVKSGVPGLGGTSISSTPYNGTHLEISSDFKEKHFGLWSGDTHSDHHHYLMAVRLDNLQFLGGYYKYAFESRIKIYEVDHGLQKSVPQEQYGGFQFLDLVTGNPHLGTTNRAGPLNLNDLALQQTLDLYAPFSTDMKVADNGSRSCSLSGYSVANNGPSARAVDGVMHTYYNSGTTEDPFLVVDLGEELPVDRIIIRWRGTAEGRRYSLLTFDKRGQHKTLHQVKTQLENESYSAKHKIYQGEVNAHKDLSALLSSIYPGGPSKADNNTLLTPTKWTKTNSYHWLMPRTKQINDDVNEVFQLKEGKQADKVRFVAIQAETLRQYNSDTKKNEIVPMQILEFEVYGYPVRRHQSEDPRLFTYKGEHWLLYNSTLSGKIYDDLADGGQGRWQFIAKIHYDGTSSEVAPRTGYFVHGHEIRKLQVPTGSQNTFLKHGRYHVEKNLVPFEGKGGQHNGKLLMIYGFDPFIVYEVDPNTGKLSELSKTDSDVRRSWGLGRLGPPRGGSPALWDSTLQAYITVFHSSIKEPYIAKVGTQTVVKYRYTYYTGLLAFQENADGQFHITNISPGPLLDPSWYQEYNTEGKKVAFAAGLSKDPDHSGQYIISSGIADQRVDITRLDRSHIAKMVAVDEAKAVTDLGALDLYAIIGLSNGAGRAPIEAVDWFPIGEHGYLYTDKGTWEEANEPLNQYSNISKNFEKQGLGPGMHFVKALLAAPTAPDQPRKVGLVVNCRGGNSLTSWLPKTDASYADEFEADSQSKYDNTLARIREAIQSGGHQLKGLVILTGEGDTETDKASKYPEVFRKLAQ